MDVAKLHHQCGGFTVQTSDFLHSGKNGACEEKLVLTNVCKFKCNFEAVVFCLMQGTALKHFTAELEKAKAMPKVVTNYIELSRMKEVLEATMTKLTNAKKKLEERSSFIKELMRSVDANIKRLEQQVAYKEEIKKVLEDRIKVGNLATALAEQLKEAKEELHCIKAELFRIKLDSSRKDSELEKLREEFSDKVSELEEELKMSRHRLAQVDKDREKSRELLAKKEEKLEEAKQELERLRNDRDKKSAKSLRELQDTRTELAKAKEDTKKKQEEIQSLKETLDSQNVTNACLQTQLENETGGLLEKENALQEGKEAMNSAKSLSVTELNKVRMCLDGELVHSRKRMKVSILHYFGKRTG